MSPDEFVERWKKSGGAEMANSQLFLTELCDLLDIPHPDGTTTDTSANSKTVAMRSIDSGEW
jgi:hypothetical protein